MRCIAFLSLLALSIITAHAPAADEKTVTVVAEGVGKDEKEARKAAFRDAVSKVVGTLIDAETLVKNDEVISEKILEYSGGFIKTYDTLKTEATDGLVRVRIKAVVERTQIIGKLSDSKVSSKEVRGTDLLAEKTTKEEARKNATELLAKLFADLPKLMQAEVVGKPRFNKNGDAVLVDVLIGVDQKAYGEFVKKAVPLLDKLAVTKGNVLLSAKEDSHFRGVMAYDDAPFKKSLSGDVLKGWPVWVTSHVDARYEKARWGMYWIDAEMAKSITPAQGDYRLQLLLTDAKDEIVAEDEVRFNKLIIGETGGCWFRYQPYKDDYREEKDVQGRAAFLISPFIMQLDGIRLGPGGTVSIKHAFVLKVPYQFSLKLSDNELERIKTVKATIITKP